jgi:hypothetical protein
MTADPFRAPEQAAPKVKTLVYGASGVGKTYLALTAPGPIAVIDTEGGTAFYANRPGLSPFRVLPTKTFAQVEQAVGFIRGNPGSYATLVIDPVTVLYQTLQDAAQQRRAEVRRDAEADMEMLDWQRVKRAYSRLMNDLVNLPMHVVVVAREADLTEERTNAKGRTERVKIGSRPEAEKSTTYHFDTVLRLVPTPKGREAIVEKDRTGTHALGARLLNPSFGSLFASVLAGTGTADRAIQSDADASRIDAATTMAEEELRDREETLTPLGRVSREGIVERGEGLRSNLLARPQADGTYAFGFLLNTGGNQRPQVVAVGPLGAWLFEAVDGATEDLVKARVSVEGELYEVTRAGARKIYRLVMDAISGPFGTFPAPVGTAPVQDAPQAEAEPVAAPDATTEEDAAREADLDSLLWS